MLAAQVYPNSPDQICPQRRQGSGAVAVIEIIHPPSDDFINLADDDVRSVALYRSVVSSLISALICFSALSEGTVKGNSRPVLKPFLITMVKPRKLKLSRRASTTLVFSSFRVKPRLPRTAFIPFSIRSVLPLHSTTLSSAYLTIRAPNLSCTFLIFHKVSSTLR